MINDDSERKARQCAGIFSRSRPVGIRQAPRSGKTMKTVLLLREVLNLPVHMAPALIRDPHDDFCRLIQWAEHPND